MTEGESLPPALLALQTEASEAVAESLPPTLSGHLFLLQALWKRHPESRYRVLLLLEGGPAWRRAILALLREQELLTTYEDLVTTLFYDPALYDGHCYGRQLLRENLPRERFSFFMHRWSKTDKGFHRVAMPPVVHLVVALLHLFPIPDCKPVDPDTFEEYFETLSTEVEPFAREGAPYLLLYPVARLDERHRGSPPSRLCPGGPKRLPPEVYPASFLLFVHSPSPGLAAQFRRGHVFLKDTSYTGSPLVFAKRCRLLASGGLRNPSGHNLYSSSAELIERCNTAAFHLQQFLPT